MNLNPTLLLGRPEQIRRPTTHALARPKRDAAHADSRLRTTADARVPRDRETGRGGGTDGGLARRRWLLR